MSLARPPGKQSWRQRKSRSKVHALIPADSALDVVRKHTEYRVCPPPASLDKTLCRRRCWRGRCALNRVAFDNDPPAEGALPADRRSFWYTAGVQGGTALGAVAAAHNVCLLGFTACGSLSETDSGDWFSLDGGMEELILAD